VTPSPETVPLSELDTLWSFDDPASSERAFQVVAARARGESDGAFLAETLTQLARAQGLQQRFDDARSTLDEAEAALRPDDPRARVRLLLERGRVANSSGADGRGSASFLEAWELARAAGEDALAVDAAHMLGIVEPHDEAWSWNERAMELARSSPDPRARRWVGSLANNMGWARHEAGRYDDALALFRIALDERRATGSPDQLRVARWCVARCLRSLGRVDEALAEQRALAGELAAAGLDDGYVDEELGECLLALGREDEARPSFARAAELLAGDPTVTPERLERLRAAAGTAA
jgi:tetratricopeptide (TPR) repeat protein